MASLLPTTTHKETAMDYRAYIDSLIAQADELDELGLHKEAEQIDKMIQDLLIKEDAQEQDK